MRRLAPFVTPLLVVVAFALHWGDVISGRQAVGLAVAVEVVLFGRAFWHVGRFSRAYRASRRDGERGGTAVRDAIVRAGGGPFAAVFLGETLVWLSLWRYVRGGWKRQSGDYTYHRRSPLIGLVFVTLITAPAELLIIELIVPWRSVRLALLLVALYSLLWILGYAAAQLGSPHRLSDRDLLVQKGFLARAAIPLAAIERVALCSGPLPPGAEPWGAAVIDGTAYFAIAGRADVELRLRSPVTVRHLVSDTPGCARLRLAADTPERLVAAIGARLTAQPDLDTGILVRQERG
jgi:hypothetical protein